MLLSLVLIPSFFSSVSYDIVGSVQPPANSESDKTLKILDAQFPELINTSQNILSVVVQGASVYSDSLKDSILKLNGTISKDKDVSNFTGETSLYSIEASLLDESLPEIVSQTASLQSNITTINSGLYVLQDNLTTLSTSIFQLQYGINQTAQLVFGVPAAFVGVWQGVVQGFNAQGIANPDPYMVNAQANSTVFTVTSNFGNNAQSIGYYTAFFNAWNSSYTTLPVSTSISEREAFAVGQAVSSLISSPQLDSQTSQMIGLVASGLTVSNWTQLSAIENLTASTIVSSIPSNLSSSLGVSATSLVNELY